MINSCVAPHALKKGKPSKDRIFGASEAAQKRISEIGKDNVINATIGCILDNDEKFVVLPTVSKIYRGLKDDEYFRYAPIMGLPEYLELVQNACFSQSRPEAFTAAIATAGGTGAIHHAVWNYAEVGDTVLTSEWYWGAYKNICEDMDRHLDTYPMVTEDNKFNLAGCEKKVREILAKQDRILLIINTPAHNPTGFSLTPEEIENVLKMLESCIEGTEKKAVLCLDVAYIDYAGDREEVRKIFRKLSNLPKNIFGLIAYSLSKSFTMYGQRCGALIGVTNDEKQILEFINVNKITSRACWSNCNRGAMDTLDTIYSDEHLLDQIQQERAHYYTMIQERGDIFTEEAEACGLKMLPYISGFFLSIPAKDPEAVCNKLHEDNIFCVPLAAGVRVAVCGVPKKKIYGMAAKIKAAMDALGED